MIFRNLIWLIPMTPLITIDRTIIVDVNNMNFMLYINKTIGAIFCHVRINKAFNQSKPSITSGNQKWKGAIPIFVRREEFILNIIIDWEFRFVKIFLFIIIRMIDNKMIVEAIACTMKYLIEDSADSLFFLLCIRGIIDNRLISRPNHIPNQE